MVEAGRASSDALNRSWSIQSTASTLGFDWPDLSGPIDKLDEEMGELRDAIAAGKREAIEAELGDVLFAAVNVARHLAVRPELALASTTERFLARFRFIEARLAERGIRPIEASLAEMDALWEEAKAASEL